MICKVRETIEKYRMPLKNATVVVAVSGGADSMALLHILYSLKDEYNIRLIACHVNHGIRGEEADSDEQFVKNCCKKLGVELHTLKADVPKLAAESGMGEEECGRKVRYDFFNSVAEKALIATAHTLSDRCETLLFNITRGASVKGLCSIPAVRDNIIRPLIDCSSSEVRAYCADNGIEYVNDSTNFEDKYTRNRIRLNVIPQLKAINPSVESSLSRLMDSARSDSDYFDSLTDSIIAASKLSDGGYAVKYFSDEHEAVKSRVITEILKTEADIRPEKVHIRLVEDILSGGKAQITGGVIAECKDGELMINPTCENVEKWERDFSSLRCESPGQILTGEIINISELQQSQNVHNNVLDFDSIIGKPVMRSRNEGDKIRLAGSSCTKTLKKLFNEKKLKNRNTVPVLADDLGVVWIYGIGCCERCKITEKTKSVMIIRGD